MTRLHPLLATALLATALAGCDSGPPVPEPAPSGPASPFIPPLAPPPEPDLTPLELGALAGRDCRAVAESYFAALERGAFHFAAAFWDDPVIDAERLAAVFSDYVTPRIVVVALEQEPPEEEVAAAATLTCTVGGVLTDSSQARTAPVEGEIVLRRANDAPEAEARDLRWTIRASTLIEPLRASRRGEPD